MGTSYQRLRARVDAYEVETGELRKAIAAALEDGSLHPAGAAAELVARAIRGGATSYTKALKKHGVDQVGGFGGENLSDRKPMVEKSAHGAEHDMTERIRKNANK